jgi:predicted transposase/invertase (TIGR01784 family)
MRTDTIFYQLFQTFNNLLFELLNQPIQPGYQFISLEVKEKAFRFDGIFAPDNLNQPIYFIEVQFQPKPNFYLQFLSEILLYLNQYQPPNDWKAVAIFADQGIEPRCARAVKCSNGTSIKLPNVSD